MERETSDGGDGAPMSSLLELEEPASRERMGKQRRTGPASRAGRTPRRDAPLTTGS